ncbi:hypothetical protein F0U44_22005 [Nocardioides humilatus]|uniref:Uncharacterized protein n=1 Tax=Nocardioides humilatus TaxID=2607660 RepID=A0A5B1L4J1_9ACTN|nr:hypothetical protein [Nocardioides humilatus]KAA1415356.1 hypothetical protein F0U44_22005 [Nocardioides humilatus]
MGIEPEHRAILSVAAAAREVADLAYTVVRRINEPAIPQDRIRAWRSLRLQALAGLDRCVLAELLVGATWAQVAHGYGLTPEQMQKRFEPTLHRWLNGTVLPEGGPSAEFTTGLVGDTDPAGTAAALDLWIMRHTEPWMDYPIDPVTRAISEEY